MSRLFGITYYVRSLCRCTLAPPSWMPVRRCSTSEQSPPLDGEVLSAEGLSHLNEHQNANRIEFPHNENAVPKETYSNNSNETYQDLSNEDLNAGSNLSKQNSSMNAYSDQLGQTNESEYDQDGQLHSSVLSDFPDELTETWSEQKMDPELERNVKSIIQLCGTRDAEITDDNCIGVEEFHVPFINKMNFDSGEMLDEYISQQVESDGSVRNPLQDSADNAYSIDASQKNLQSNINQSPISTDNYEADGEILGLSPGKNRNVDLLDIHGYKSAQVYNSMKYSGCRSRHWMGQSEYCEAPCRIDGLHDGKLKILHQKENLRRLSNKTPHDSRNQNDGFYQSKNPEPYQQKGRDDSAIPSYKPFRTIEVPITVPDAKEAAKATKKSEHPENVKYEGVNQDADLDKIKKAGKTEIETNMEDPDSRQLMRYALLRALHRLDSGTGYFSAKITITEP